MRSCRLRDPSERPADSECLRARDPLGMPRAGVRLADVRQVGVELRLLTRDELPALARHDGDAGPEDRELGFVRAPHDETRAGEGATGDVELALAIRAPLYL